MKLLFLPFVLICGMSNMCLSSTDANEKLVTMSIRVETDSELAKIHYTINNSSDVDIYVFDVSVSFSGTNAKLDVADFKRETSLFGGTLLLSSIVYPIPEGISMMSLPTYYMSRVAAKSVHKRTKEIKMPIYVKLPIWALGSKVVKNLRIEFGYLFENESFNMKTKMDLADNVFSSFHIPLELQKIVSAEAGDLSLKCAGRY